MASVVPINLVIPSGDTRWSSVKRMELTLDKQGQIEPLQVKPFTMDDGEQVYITFLEDAWGCEIVQAARNLGWPSLLITVETKFQY